MTSVLVKMFERKFFACCLFLEHCGDDVCSAESERRSNDIVAHVLNARMSRAEEMRISEIVASKAAVWNVSDTLFGAVLHCDEICNCGEIKSCMCSRRRNVNGGKTLRPMRRCWR